MSPPDTMTDAPPGRGETTRRVRMFFLAWMIAFTGAVTPGPMLALVIGQVLAQGLRAAVFILLGHAAIEGLFILLISRGLANALKADRVRAGLALVGGAALGWMGIDMLVHLRDMSIEAAATDAMSWYWLFLGGIGVSLSNPYFTGWWATVGTGQVATFGLRSAGDHIVFWIGHELGDVVWFLFVALLLVLGRTWLNDRIYHILLWLCGSAIVLLAAGFVAAGIRLVLTNRSPSEATAREPA